MKTLLSLAGAMMMLYAASASGHVSSNNRDQGRIFFNVNGTNNLANTFGTLLMTLPALLLPIIFLVGLGAIAMALFSKFTDDDYRRRSFENATGLNIDNILEKLDRLPAIVNTLANTYAK